MGGEGAVAVGFGLAGRGIGRGHRTVPGADHQGGPPTSVGHHRARRSNNPEKQRHHGEHEASTSPER